ncbi:MAG: TetR family transcriptional regulator [Aquabacterium sp.]|nr:TetR family transcriptional regulator [Aquabacterium sp.]
MNSPEDVLASPAQPTASPARRYGGLTAQERRDLRRRKLLDAAVQVFGTLGLRRATVRDICNEARITERYFSEHFASISEAYEAAFKLISEQALLATGRAMLQARLDTLELARAGLQAFLGFVQEDPRRAQILLVDASSYWRNPNIKNNNELKRHAQAMRFFCKRIYPDLPGHIDLEIIGASLVGASLQACLTWVQSGFRQPIEQVVDHLMFIWDGLDRWFRAEIQAG